MSSCTSMTRNEGKPLVSVVIPNFNYGRYLDLRIQSVLKQTFHNFELILLDDASVDNSLEILKLYGGGGMTGSAISFLTTATAEIHSCNGTRAYSLPEENTCGSPRPMICVSRHFWKM